MRYHDIDEGRRHGFQDPKGLDGSSGRSVVGLRRRPFMSWCILALAAWVLFGAIAMAVRARPMEAWVYAVTGIILWRVGK